MVHLTRFHIIFFHFNLYIQVWNNIGIVKQTNTEEENVIDVEFHDTTRHHAFRINNIQSHTLAALSEEALVMAAPQTLDHPRLHLEIFI